MHKSGDSAIFSRNGNTESHNEGQDCISCHSNNKEGNVNFSLAGTVYKFDQLTPYPNISINLYNLNIDDNDFPIETIEVDGNGNFYTNVPIDWNINQRITIESGYESRSKIISSYMGSCNGCHGLTISRLSLN